MAAKTYSLEFGGYWTEQHISGIPAQSGVYGVYAATYDAENNTVNLNRLIYIGEAGDVRDRILRHEKWPMWRRELRSGEVLCFNMAPVSPEADRQRAEAAMIFEHKPVCNDEYKYAFPFDQTTLMTGGRNALMKAQFTVYTTPAAGRAATLLTGQSRW